MLLGGQNCRSSSGTVLYGRGHLGSIWGRSVAPNPFPLLLYFLYGIDLQLYPGRQGFSLTTVATPVPDAFLPVSPKIGMTVVSCLTKDINILYILNLSAQPDRKRSVGPPAGWYSLAHRIRKNICYDLLRLECWSSRSKWKNCRSAHWQQRRCTRT